MKVLVTCVPQAGHLNPMAELIAAFVAAGDDVVVASGEAVRQRVEGLGARFERAGDGLEEWFGQLAARTRGNPGDGLPPARIPHYFAPRLFGEIAAPNVIDDLLAVGRRLRPDLVMFDAEAFAGPLAARLLGARQVSHLFGPILAPDVTELVNDALAPLWRSFDLAPPRHAGLYDGITVAICPASLEPVGLPGGTRLALRPAPPPVREPRPQSPPLVYFSLGTMWANARITETVLTGLADLPISVVATLGSLDPAEIATVPSNVQLHQFIPQEQVLPDASLVVHHAGAGTMFGALAHGAPQVALPQAADNFINAELLTRSGAGLALQPDEVTSAAIAEAVTTVLTHASFATAARGIAAEIDSMPTADAVADLLRAEAQGT